MKKGQKKIEGVYTRVLKEARNTCREKFVKSLAKGLEKYFNKKASYRILSSLERGRLEIRNPEAFNSVFFQHGDPSLAIYQESKTFSEFFFKILDTYKEMVASGFSEIQVRELFMVMSDMLNRENKIISKEILKPYIYAFVSLFSEQQNSCSYEIQVLDIYLKRDAEKVTGLNLESYGTVINMLFEAIAEFREFLTKASMPHIALLLGIHEDTKILQKTYLVDTFLTTMDRVGSLTKNLTSLSEDTPELRSVLELLKAERGYSNFNTDSIVLELQRLEGNSRFNNFYLNRTITDNFRKYQIPRNVLDLYKIKTVFTNTELFLESMKPHACEIIVDCKKIQATRIENLIGQAKTLCLLKSYVIQRVEQITKKTSSPYFKITLENVSYFTQDYINQLKEKLKNIESITNKNFIMEVHYLPEEARKEVRVIQPEYIRVISDIHTDVNKEQGYTFNFGEDFVINCGDTAGNSVVGSQWLLNHVKEGVTVIGNHLGYSSAFPELDGIQNIEIHGSTIHDKNTKNMQSKSFAELLGGSRIKYLTNSATEFEGITILGTCLYTDFCLYGEKHREGCMAYAKKYMNDFKLPMLREHRKYTLTKEGWDRKNLRNAEVSVRPFTTNDHAYYFHYSLNFLKEKLTELNGKPVIIVTHHAPSPHSISQQYEGDLLNAAFASNLNDFILAHPNIRLWCHGHMHQPFDYILGETRVVCEPFGYYNENKYSLPYKYGKRIKIEDIKSNTSWKELLASEIKRGKVKVYEN